MMSGNSGAAVGAAAKAYSSAPSVLVVADGAARKSWCSAADEAGLRVTGAVGLDGAEEQLDRRIALDAVVLDLGPGDEAALAPLLGRLLSAADAGLYGSVVASPLALVDRVAGLVGGSEVQHVCEPDDEARLAALREAARRRPPRLSDINKAQATVRLQQLSEEVGRIAHALASLSEDEAAAAALETEPAEGERTAIDGAFIRSIIRARRLRDHFFRSDLFADPAWDMLLDLMAARVEKQRVAVSSLCIAAAVPPTTALRWIKMLCDRGLFVRIADPEDGRRVFIELSDDAAEALGGYLRAAQRLGALIV